MTALVERWCVPAETPRILRAGTLGGEEVLALVANSGAGEIFAGDGRSLARFPRLKAHHVALGSELAFFACRPGRLVAVRPDGAAAWDVDLESRAVGRVFAGHRQDVIVILSRRKKFLMERYAQADGTFLETRTIERRRALLSRDLRRLWMRDKLGITSLRIDGYGVTRVPLPGNGPVGESGDVAVTPVAPDSLACIAGDELRWQVQIEGRDLREVAIADELDVDDDEYAPAHLGRPLIDGDQALVADANGTLHARDLRTGGPRWRLEGDHYPSVEWIPTPLRIDDLIAYVGTDEMVYLLDREGNRLSALELPGPPLAEPVSLAGGLVLCSGGLRRYDLK